MQVDRKYYRNETIHHTLLPVADDITNFPVSCGFLHKQGNACVQKNFTFPCYGGIYVISGTGVYIDAATQKEYPVKPGCVIQRLPGVVHHILIDPDSDWLEFYIAGSTRVFYTLHALKLVTDEPVFFAGETEEIFHRLLEYHELFKKTDDRYSHELMIEFQRLLCFLNGNPSSSQSSGWTDLVQKKLEQNCNIGVSLKQIAAECGIGYETLRKQFPRYFGCSLEKYRIQLRINAAKSMLLDKKMPVKQVACELGYCDVYAFCKQFKQQEGFSPSEFVKRIYR